MRDSVRRAAHEPLDSLKHARTPARVLMVSLGTSQTRAQGGAVGGEVGYKFLCSLALGRESAHATRERSEIKHEYLFVRNVSACVGFARLARCKGAGEAALTMRCASLICIKLVAAKWAPASICKHIVGVACEMDRGFRFSWAAFETPTIHYTAAATVAIATSCAHETVQQARRTGGGGGARRSKMNGNLTSSCNRRQLTIAASSTRTHNNCSNDRLLLRCAKLSCVLALAHRLKLPKALV